MSAALLMVWECQLCYCWLKWTDFVDTKIRIRKCLKKHKLIGSANQRRSDNAIFKRNKCQNGKQWSTKQYTEN